MSVKTWIVTNDWQIPFHTEEPDGEVAMMIILGVVLIIPFLIVLIWLCEPYRIGGPTETYMRTPWGPVE